MSLLRSTATIGGYTLISRVFGFVRDMLIAAVLGASAYSDAFFVAFKLPNFMRRLFAEGAFNSAFVPLFAGILTAEGREEARKFAEEVGAVLLVALLIVTALAEIFTPAAIYVLAPGFSDDPAKFELSVVLTRITFPYLLFISLVSLLGAILNSLDRFAAVASTPIIMNLCMIFALLALEPVTPTAAHAAAWGVMLAGIAQFLWLVWFCRKAGLLPRLVRPRINDNVRKLLKLIAPAALGAGVAQINLMIDVIIGSQIPEGVSYLYYADRISELPLAVIGIAVGTALLPMLSRQIREGNDTAAHHSQNRAIELCLLLALPAAAALMVIAEPVIRVIYERGAFHASDTRQTFITLIAFAAGLPSFVLVKVLAPSFFARHDTKTPFIIATICVIINLIGNLTLIGPLAQVGLALSTSIAGWVNALSLGWILHRRGFLVIDHPLKRRLPRMLLATLFMAAALYGGLMLLMPFFDGSLFVRSLALTALVLLGLAVYGLSALLLGATDTAKLKSYLNRRIRKSNAPLPDQLSDD